MWVVADSSPLHYLILVHALDVLPALFDEIHISEAVQRELTHPSAPSDVQALLESPPNWLRVHRTELTHDSEDSSPLGLGESEAISLAVGRLPDALLVVDDAKAREAASRAGVPLIGMLGVLDLAAQKKLVQLPTVLERLVETSFYVAPRILKALLDEDRKRRQK